jgi:hypothetical protein
LNSAKFEFYIGGQNFAKYCLLVALEQQVGGNIQMHSPACESDPAFVFDVFQLTETAERNADILARL